jgi:DNA-binding transcriptional LysR family regulator
MNESTRFGKLDVAAMRLILALHDQQSVGRAAELLGIGQPSASMSLRRLRKVFGDALFVRSARGVSPTPRAVMLVSPLREILHRLDVDVAVSRGFDPGTTKTVFTIAMSDVSEMALVPRIIENMLRLAPNATIKVVTPSTPKLVSGLANGSIDLALGYFSDLSSGNHIHQRLYSHSFVCLARANHKVASNRMTPVQFASCDHVLVHAEGSSQQIFEQHCRKLGISLNVVLRAAHFMSVPPIVAGTDLLATVPLAVGAVFSSFAGIRVLRPPFKCPRFALSQHWHRRFNSDARHKWLRTQLVLPSVQSISDRWTEFETAID